MKQNKISVFSPRKDKCDFCCSYEVGYISEEEFADHIAKKKIEQEMKSHRIKC